ncbi:uncharacterized protein LOC131661201 [Vicia villosa]|uniref:uncharacterized protein LOC131661201 n=1 Tax=Vicia villosa TaxID=3911 RepID=UPI00273BA7EC|nr:uncharacterized protein LOC131661201 [Vicia villosa]XP_058786636.1 uncharacterized protein LOC131661201 [Vicia villosa]
MVLFRPFIFMFHNSSTTSFIHGETLEKGNALASRFTCLLLMACSLSWMCHFMEELLRLNFFALMVKHKIFCLLLLKDTNFVFFNGIPRLLSLLHANVILVLSTEATNALIVDCMLLFQGREKTYKWLDFVWLHLFCYCCSNPSCVNFFKILYTCVYPRLIL